MRQGVEMDASATGIKLGRGSRVLFTERDHGNLSSVGGDAAEHGERARAHLQELAGLRALARGYQVHGTVVQRLRKLPDPHAEQAHADGQATALQGVGVVVLSADCLPVALGCNGAVAMVHAGWRGLAAGVLEEGLQALQELGAGEEIVALVGPGAGACCYEVGAEVRQAFNDAHVHAGRIDLRAIAHDRLLAAGVAEVGDVDACTICDERYFSHRREGVRAGRQGGVAWLS